MIPVRAEPQPPPEARLPGAMPHVNIDLPRNWASALRVWPLSQTSRRPRRCVLLAEGSGPTAAPGNRSALSNRSPAGFDTMTENLGNTTR